MSDPKPVAHAARADGRTVRVPPRWFVTRAWAVHRNIHRLTGGHLGLWRPRSRSWGTMRLTTIGRRTGHDRSVILAYIEDGSDLVTLAMNGWGEGDPAWWLNLQAHPQVLVETRDGVRAVTAREVSGAEHSRLWDRWREVEQSLDAHASRRSTPTSLVILSPRTPAVVPD
ncbi:nitroreductase family deazaflavin-dependent oxidoreductase [Ornithinimicrobium sp. F0845]|uniref:nitroreductase/quinone reductase family protein n=1 Tax=Ornithinimicrobium sp. F0845 TaxID=2926412 RepID=UPI001FF19E93|nr:nitroreductase/quinone reductase family protein [Ornithinimicrobium sp. F0845]MCK0112598.1 nitroreductase family deazaflavin-dependent oxidoreductase [Ornithinimicrobium sp. F0845]